MIHKEARMEGLSEERRATLDIFCMQHLGADPGDLARKLLVLLRHYSGCEALAIRLRKGPDFPYAASHGFSPEFLALESRLCARNSEGCLLRDGNGNPLLECMCGNVLAGRIDPTQPYFTNHSFCTNSTTALLASTTPEQRQGSTRNRCMEAGYESMALIPIRLDGHVYGLFQCNDHRPNCFTSERITLLESLADSAAHLFQLAMV